MNRRPVTPRRIRATLRTRRDPLPNQRPMIQVQQLRLARWGGTVTASGRTVETGWEWVTVDWLEVRDTRGTIIVIERYWDTADNVQRQHYGCDLCHQPVSHWVYSLGDAHQDCQPHTCGDLCRRLNLTKRKRAA